MQNTNAKSNKDKVIYNSIKVVTEDVNAYKDFIYQHHLDDRGLIEKGLALEAPEGMYNVKG